MAKQPKKAPEKAAAANFTAENPVPLSKLLATKPDICRFRIWLVGDSPLITHAWSEKAKRQMLERHGRAPIAGRQERKPEDEYKASLYEMGDGVYGFPVTGIKNCILSRAHKDRGTARTDVRSSLWLDSPMSRVRPALAGAICDMPLVRIWGDAPEMREDMVKIGAGLNKTANLAYRGQFTRWAIRISGRYNSIVINEANLGSLINEAGVASGLGEWRNERNGVFGKFHVANPDEDDAWEDFAAGRRKDVPVVVDPYLMAAE
jgi:hypothetical protein